MTRRSRTLAVLAAAACAAASLALAPAASAASCGLKTYADGTVGPITCKGGKANMRIKMQLTGMSPAVMALGKGASLGQLKKAVCSDQMKAKASNPMVDGAIAWQSAQNGWPKSYANWFTNEVVMGTGMPGC